MKTLVFGATSAIAQAAAAQLAKLSDPKNKPSFYLVGRNLVKLERTVAELRQNNSASIAGYEAADLRDFKEIAKIVQRAHSTMGELDAVIIAQGTLIKQSECAADIEKFRQLVDENFISECVCLNCVFEVMNYNGVIAVVTSVAGDAARPGSALYSATKAALSRYIQGLRGLFWKKRIKIIDVRPGWVATPMTSHMKRTALFAKPSQVGSDIAHAMINHSPSVLYTPWWWTLMMTPFKILPNGLYRYVKR